MSVASLKRCALEPGYALRHDRLDDLESVYYVFVIIMFTHRANGDPLEETPDEFEDWCEKKARSGRRAKKEHFNGAATTRANMSPLSHKLWSEPSVDALKRCFDIIRKVVIEKADLELLDTQDKIQRLANLMDNAGGYFSSMYNALETALTELPLDSSGPFPPAHRRHRPMFHLDPPPSLMPSDGHVSLVGEFSSALTAVSPGPKVGSALLPFNKKSVLKRMPQMELDPEDEDFEASPSKARRGAKASASVRDGRK